MVVFQGTKLLLREKKAEDAANDYAWRKDPELARFDAAVPTRTSYAEFMEAYLAELASPSPRQRRYAIESQDGKHIGNCMYYNIDLEKSQVELGIMIGDRDHWGNGYGTDTVKTLVDAIFSTTTIERVYLSTLDWNYRAQRCFEKSGFVPCGRHSWNGHRFIVMETRRTRQEKPQAEEPT